MARTPDIQGGVAPADRAGARAAAEDRRQGWNARHWRGELGLGDAFWINGVIVSLAFNLLNWGLTRLAGDDPDWLWVFVVVPVLLFEVAVTVWQVVGVWRSAARFPGRRLWPVAARVIAVIWAVELPVLVVEILG